MGSKIQCGYRRLILKQDVKRKWIDGLRNGDYKEGKNALRIIRGHQHLFSAIGVLCDIVDNSGWEEINKYRYAWHHRFYMPETSILENLSGIKYEMLSKILYMISDGLRFEDIAEFIEEYIVSEEL
jgi:hypothetical protein